MPLSHGTKYKKYKCYFVTTVFPGVWTNACTCSWSHLCLNILSQVNHHINIESFLIYIPYILYILNMKLSSLTKAIICWWNRWAIHLIWQKKCFVDSWFSLQSHFGSRYRFRFFHFIKLHDYIRTFWPVGMTEVGPPLLCSERCPLFQAIWPIYPHHKGQ